MPKIFLVIALLLIAGWVVMLSGGMDCSPSSRPRGGGEAQARAMLLVDPQVFASESMETEVHRFAEQLNNPETIRTLLRQPAAGRLPSSVRQAVMKTPSRFVQAQAEGASFIELTIRGCGSVQQAEDLARLLGNLFAQSVAEETPSGANPIQVTRVVRLQ